MPSNNSSPLNQATQQLPNKAPVNLRRKPRGETAGHWIVFTACFGMLAVAFLLPPPKPGKGLQVAGMPTPQICQFRVQTGLDCPGCGLTRSWVSAAHGRFESSLSFHPLGWLLMLYTLLQFFRHGACLLWPRVRRLLKQPGKWLDRSLIPLSILLFLIWPVRLAQQLGIIG